MGKCMIKLKKDGVVRIVTTEAEAEQWKSLGYKVIEADAPITDGAGDDALAGMDADQLKEYAAANGIDIGNATSQNGILKKIQDARSAGTGV